MAIGTEVTTIYDMVSQLFGVSVEAAVWIVTILMIWALVWKGLALWKSAGRKQPIWFIIILVTNTIGILPIIYLLIYKEKQKPSKKKSKKKKK